MEEDEEIVEVLFEEGGLKEKPRETSAAEQKTYQLAKKETQQLSEEEKIVRDELQSVPQKVETSALQLEPESQLTEQPETCQREKSLENLLFGFRTIKLEGSGGISDVYLVEQESTGARFAYKTLNQDGVNKARTFNPDARIFFSSLLREEAKLTARMGEKDKKHFPSVVVNLSLTEENPGFLTEYIPHSLEEQIGKLDQRTALSYFLHACEAIKALHKDEREIVLADIKPSQFRIDDEGNVKLVDLNLKYSESPENIGVASIVHSVAFSMIDSPSKVKGTPRYMAPEQWEMLHGNPAKIDKTTDVFQLGSLLYELMTGKKQEGTYKSIGGEFTALDEIVQKAREGEQRERFQSVDELTDVIKQKLEHKLQPQQQTEIKAATLEQKVQNANAEKLEISAGETARETARSFYKIALGVGKAASFLGGLVFAIPTNIRKARDFTKENTDGGSTVGECCLAVLTNLVTYGVMKNKWGADGYADELLIAQLATNALSGAYELWRYSRNKVKARYAALSPEERAEIEMLKKIRKGDLSMYAGPDNFGDKWELKIRGASNFYETFKGKDMTEESFVRELMEKGFAKNERFAKSITTSLKHKSFMYHANSDFSCRFKVIPVTNTAGEARYRVESFIAS